MVIDKPIKKPLRVLGFDKNYYPLYNENVADQIIGLGRRPNTEYVAGDVVTSSTNNQLQLLCTTGGTTAATDLDISANSIGDSITDGTVVWACFSRMQAGVPVGFEYFSTNPNIPAGSLPLFGGEYSREVYKDLWEWVQTQTGYLLEESDWQAKASANDGNVPFYSKGDGSTTFRVPSLKCWIKGANGIEEVGSYLSAGLPNIEGSLYYALFYGSYGTGAFNSVSSSASYGGGSDSSAKKYSGSFDASLSNPIYGNSDTVQPKSIVGMWLVKAYGTVTNVGSTDVAAIAQGLTEAETRIGQLENHGAGATVVESYRNGTEWYRVWSDGWLEQGGYRAMPSDKSEPTITLLKAFYDVNYNICINNYYPNVTNNNAFFGVKAVTKTSFIIDWARIDNAAYPAGWYWRAEGVGA